MIEVKVKDSLLQQEAEKGMDEFIQVFVSAIHDAIGGDLNAENMQELNADQITLLAYVALRDEVMDGGFVQLIHNGYGAFIFLNPFNKAVRAWGLQDLHRVISKCHRLYVKYRDDIERECSDEDFMALFEKFPDFDEFDDEFVEKEEEWTTMVAQYVDNHISSFATIVE